MVWGCFSFCISEMSVIRGSLVSWPMTSCCSMWCCLSPQMFLGCIFQCWGPYPWVHSTDVSCPLLEHLKNKEKQIRIAEWKAECRDGIFRIQCSEDDDAIDSELMFVTALSFSHQWSWECSSYSRKFIGRCYGDGSVPTYPPAPFASFSR